MKKNLYFLLVVILLAAALPVPALATTELDIDVKPCQDPNTLNVRQKGVIPVALDPTDVDETSLTLEGVPASSVYINYQGVMMAQFSAPAVLATLGTVYNGQVVTLTLAGEFDDGTTFYGEDDVIIVKK